MMVTASPNWLTTNALLTVDDHSTTSAQRSPDNGRDDAVTAATQPQSPSIPLRDRWGLLAIRDADYFIFLFIAFKVSEILARTRIKLQLISDEASTMTVVTNPLGLNILSSM